MDESVDAFLKTCFLFPVRTYHRVIAGEHDKAYGSNEAVQVLKPAKVRTAHRPVSFWITPSFLSNLSQRFPPHQVFTHPKWNPSTINNDIALIKLASPARMGTNVSPVCLAESTDVFAAGMTCVTSGWGLTRYNGETESIKSRPWG